MSDGQYISILQPVANAKAQLGISHSTEDYFLIMKAGEAENIIASNHTLVRKQLEIDIIDNTAELPADLHTLISLRTADGVYPFCAKKSFFRFNEDCPNSIENNIAYTMAVEDGIVYFSSDITADQCEIAYIGYNTDSDGFPKIHHTHETAIMHYLCMMYMSRDAERFKESQIAFHQRYWTKRCMQARANSKKPDPIESQYLKMIWNNMLRPHTQRF